MKLDQKTVAVGAGIALLAYFLWPKQAKAAAAAILPGGGGGPDVDKLRDMFSRSLLVPSKVSGRFFVETIPPPGFEPSTEAATTNNGLTLIRVMQKQANVFATQNIANEKADRSVELAQPGASVPVGLIVLPPL